MFRLTAVSLFFSGAVALPALADPITLDFGNAGQPGISTTVSQPAVNDIFAAGGEVDFANMAVPAVSVGVMAFGGAAYQCGSDQCVAETYVTQKDTAIGGQETGVGESDSPTTPSDPDLEVAPGRGLVVNNSSAIAAGYTSSQLLVNSLDPGEGVKIYGVNTLGPAGGEFDFSQLTKANLLATLIGCQAPGCTGPIAQYADLTNSYKYFVLVTLGGNVNGGSQDDFILGSDTLFGPTGVPEPASIAMLGFGVLGLLAARRRAA